MKVNMTNALANHFEEAVNCNDEALNNKCLASTTLIVILAFPQIITLT